MIYCSFCGYFHKDHRDVPQDLKYREAKYHKRQVLGLVTTWFGMHLDMQNMVLVVAL